MNAAFVVISFRTCGRSRPDVYFYHQHDFRSL